MLYLAIITNMSIYSHHLIKILLNFNNFEYDDINSIIAKRNSYCHYIYGICRKSKSKGEKLL